MDVGGIAATTIGLIFGWGLSQASEWLKRRGAENATRKKVLFCMLEVHYTVSRSMANPAPVIDRIIEKMSMRPLFSTAMEEAKGSTEMRQMVISAIMDPIGGMLETKLDDVSAKYDEAVSTLSSVSPLLAFELTDSVSVPVYKKAISGSLNASFEQVGNRSEQTEVRLRGFLSSKLDADMLETFEHRILQLAREIGICTWYKARAHLRPSILSMTEEEMDSLVSELEAVLLQAALEAQHEQSN